MSYVKLSRKSATALLELARRYAWATHELNAQTELERALTPRKPKPMAVERKWAKAAKKATKREETGAIYAEVEQRADGKCEACGEYFRPFDPPHMDHWLGRGRARQSVRNCWLIHGLTCHREKHARKPTRSHWLRLFELHCHRNGFAAEAASARAQIEEAWVRESAAVGVRR